MYVARNILSGQNADWAFQMAPGRAANIQKVVYRMSGGVLSQLPPNASTVSEPSAGNYVLNVTSASMAAGQSGDMYFATMSDGDQFVRLQAWTYDNPKHFDQVLHDLADLDADVVAVDGKVQQVLTDLASQTVTLQGDITNAKNSLSTDIGNAKNAIQADITAQTGTLQTDILNARNTIQGDIAQVKADTAAILLDTSELQQDWHNGGRLDTILDSAAADALGANTKAGDIQTSLGNLQGLQFTVGGVVTAQNDLAGALSTIYDAVDDVEADISGAVTSINAHTTSEVSAAQTAITGAITAQTGTLQGDISAAQTAIIQQVNDNEALIGAASDVKTDPTLFGKIADVKADVADLDADVVALQGDVTQEIADAGAERTAQGAERVAQGAERTAAAAERTAQGAERTAQGNFRTATAATLGTLQTDADALSRFQKLEGDIANVDGDVAALQGDVTAEIAAAGAERTAQAAERTAQGAERVSQAAERTAAAAERALQVQERSDAAAERTAQGAERTAAAAERVAQGNFRTSTTADLASIEGKVDLLETESDAAARYTSLGNGQTNIMNRLGTPTAGSTVSGDIAAIKALLDSTLTNARLLPFVPSTILSPLEVTRLRFTCNVVDGETGALEAPDNNELGVSVQLTSLAGGGSSNVSGSALFDSGNLGAGSALSAAPGGANRIPSSFMLMIPVSGRTGAFEAFLEIPAYTHGNYEFEFACYDSDPSGSPVSFSRSSFMEVRKNVGFSSAGAF